MSTISEQKNHNFNTKKHIKKLIVDNIEDESVKNHVLKYIENLVTSHNELTIAHKRKCEELDQIKKKHWE